MSFFPGGVFGQSAASLTLKIRRPRTTATSRGLFRSCCGVALGEGRWLGRMHSLRVMVVKKYRQTMSNRDVERNCCFEQLFLHAARQIRPQPQGGPTEQSFEFAGAFTHF